MAGISHKGRPSLPDVSDSAAREALALMRAIELRIVDAESPDAFTRAAWISLVAALGRTADDPTDADDLLPSEMWARYREREVG